MHLAQQQSCDCANVQHNVAGGLDSLAAVEYVNLVGRRLNLQLPSTLVFDYPTAAAVTDYLAAKLAARQPAAATRAATPSRRPALAVARSVAPASAADAVPMRQPPVYIQATLLWPLATAGGYTSTSSIVSPLPGTDCIGVIPRNRWSPDAAAGLTADLSDSISATRFGAFLQAVDQFDVAAFGLSGSEAGSMDPQHRLLLASAGQLLATPRAFTDNRLGGDSTSKSVERLLSDTGVFVGISWTEYHQLGKICGQALGANSAQGAVLSVACGR